MQHNRFYVTGSAIKLAIKGKIVALLTHIYVTDFFSRLDVELYLDFTMFTPCIFVISN
jgi:hypothetical protein